MFYEYLPPATFQAWLQAIWDSSEAPAEVVAEIAAWNRFLAEILVAARSDSSPDRKRRQRKKNEGSKPPKHLWLLTLERWERSRVWSDTGEPFLADVWLREVVPRNAANVIAFADAGHNFAEAARETGRAESTIRSAINAAKKVVEPLLSDLNEQLEEPPALDSLF